MTAIEKISQFFNKAGKKSFDSLQVDDREFLNTKHQCPSCQIQLDDKDLRNSLFVCTNCNHHFRVSAKERVSMLFDNAEYEEISIAQRNTNPIDFPGYENKLHEAEKNSGEDEAVSVAKGKILDRDVVVVCMSFSFLGGSMGVLVGERVIQGLFVALKYKCPCLLVTASGGARMHEGLYSLMQMARISHVVALYKQQRLPLFVLLTDPTTGGVTASFAMLGDYCFAEPKALIGFAGPRVIEGTIRQKLPEGFQRAEFQLEKGFVDAIVSRKNIRRVLSYCMRVHTL